MFEQTLSLLKKHGLDESDIEMIRSGEVDWELHGNHLLLFHRDGGSKHETALRDDEIEELLSVSRFEAQSADLQYHSDIFPLGSVDDWMGVAPESNWQHLTDVYSKAVNVLGGSMPPGSAEPYLFLARHTLELWLKAIIMLGQESLKLVPDLPDHHDLQRLWTAAYPVIRIKSKISKPEIEQIALLVNEYHSLDPGSFTFRYPVNKKNKAIKTDQRVRAFSLKSHSERFEGVKEVMSQLIRNLKFSIVWSRASEEYAQKGDSEEHPDEAPDL